MMQRNFLSTVFILVITTSIAHGAFVTVDDNRFYDDLSSGLRLVVERFNDDNDKFWRELAKKHDDYGFDLVRSTVTDRGAALSGNPNDGYHHFKMVLDYVDQKYHDNEIWIAYVTDNKELPQRIKTNKDQNNILYCMTVVTSPNALITSHMGIAKTMGGHVKNVRNVSVKLHSLAAEVMLHKNPLRRFMINAPAWIMESIIADAMPDGGLYVDTRERFAELLRLGDLTQNRALRSKDGKEIWQRIAEQKPNATDDEIRRETVEIIFAPYEREVKIKDGKKILFVEFQKKHPPIISLGHKDRIIFDDMKIFEPGTDEVFLTISRRDDSSRQVYNWMFTSPFYPSGNTHYIVVDLKKLAELKRD